VALVQFAVLYRNGQKASMSTRSGEYVTLRDLRAEVGNDACRFFYVLRKSDQHLDFDLDLAKSRATTTRCITSSTPTPASAELHGLYAACQFLVDDEELKLARLSLIAATRQVLRVGLALLGVSAPERMQRDESRSNPESAVDTAAIEPRA
jgi:arginyl-tRNA synthetase